MIKASDVAAKWGFKESDFEAYLSKQTIIKTSGFATTKIDEEDEEKAVDLYKKYLQSQAEEREAEAKARQAAIESRQRAEQAARDKEEAKKRALASMLISSGFNFEGYKIVKYSGYISGDDEIRIDRAKLHDDKSGRVLSDALVKIRVQALKELKEAAYALGCNAVIGVDYDYITIEQEVQIYNAVAKTPYLICVTANGNAVVIEKE